MHDEDHLITNVGARLKQLRYAAGYTQEVMANRVGSGLRNYQRLETGTINMSLRTLARLSTALDIDPQDLLFPLPQPRRTVNVSQPKTTTAARTASKTSKKTSKTSSKTQSNKSKTSKTSKSATSSRSRSAKKKTSGSKTSKTSKSRSR